MFEIPVRSNFELNFSLKENFGKIKSKHFQNNLHKAKIPRWATSKISSSPYFQLKWRAGRKYVCEAEGIQRP